MNAPTFKGLSINRIHARFTHDELEFIKVCLAAVFANAERDTGKKYDGAASLMCEIIDMHPQDRSCATCDFERSGEDQEPFCLHWIDVIPETHYDKGCPNWQSDGAPF